MVGRTAELRDEYSDAKGKELREKFLSMQTSPRVTQQATMDENGELTLQNIEVDAKGEIIKEKTFTDVLDEYAQAKLDMTILEMKIKRLQPQIKEELRKLDHNLKNRFGTFYISEKPVWTYDPEVQIEIDEKKQEIKQIEEAARKTGKAINEPRADLVFKPFQDKSQREDDDDI